MSVMNFSPHFLTLTLLAGAAFAQDAGATAAARKSATAKGSAKASHTLAPTKRVLREPEHLPEAARLAILRLMTHHAEDVTELMFAVLFLQYEDAATLANSIKDEPRLSRPSADDDLLNKSVSSKFFTFQDDLRRRAGEVAVSAGKQDSKGMSEAYGRMMQVCVSCHATYLEFDEPAK